MSMSEQTELRLDFKEAAPAPEIYAARSWRGVSVQHSRLKLPAEYEFTWDGRCHYLAHHDLVLADGEMEVSGERPVAGRDLRDQMTYVPVGQTFQGWAKPADRLNAFTVVCFDPAVMEEEVQAEFSGAVARPGLYFKDDVLGATMRKLARVMPDSQMPASRIYAETLGLTAALEMFRVAVARYRPNHGVGQLSRSQREMVRSYVEENLSKDMGLDELAALCGLSRYHFSRAFKETFSEPPYQYVTRRRIEEARDMLVETKLPVADIAVACGFKGASQFGRAFRLAVGTTPLAFRRRA
jgi:AraC family transcriptional regulator